MMDAKTEINTQFGIAKYNENTGYYRVQSSEKNINNKYLHHLIWENHYNRSIPNGYIIHHINGIKIDNRIQNLICVPKKIHDSFHSRHRTKETIEKIRNSCTKKNARIVKNGKFNGKQKYCIQYKGNRIKTSVSILKLKQWFEKNYPNQIITMEKI